MTDQANYLPINTTGRFRLSVIPAELHADVHRVLPLMQFGRDYQRGVADDFATAVRMFANERTEEGQYWFASALAAAERVLGKVAPEIKWDSAVDGEYIRVTLTIPTGAKEPSGRGIRAHNAAHKLAKATWGDNTRIIRITSGGGSDNGSVFYTWTFSHAAM